MTHPHKVEPQAGDSLISVGGATFLYRPPMVPEPAANPYLDKLPTDEELAVLVAEQTRTSDELNALTTEQAALPMLRGEAVANGDATAMAKTKARELSILDELALAKVAMAKARYELAMARYAVAYTNRERTRGKAFALGPAPENGYPNGQQAHLEASAVYEEAQWATRETFIALGAAKRNLDAALVAAQFGK